MSAEPAPSPSATDRCITCGDVASELEVVSVEPAGLALCRGSDGRTETVEVALAGDVVAGDRLLVHAGTAIANLGAEAQA